MKGYELHGYVTMMLNLAVGDTVKETQFTTYEMSIWKLLKFLPKRVSLLEKLKQELAPEMHGFRHNFSLFLSSSKFSYFFTVINCKILLCSSYNIFNSWSTFVEPQTYPNPDLTPNWTPTTPTPAFSVLTYLQFVVHIHPTTPTFSIFK